MNRLGGATSPYLLQHAANPVDWWPWCDEAFAVARERGVPVLLSVGYSACHWCHVMAHESFEDEQTAALMNEHLVSIKVDREERPDVDSVYMAATQAMTGQGGWPMTVFMTPEREPFFCGTYFPRTQFQRLILGVAKAWGEDRGQVAAQASQIAAALAERAAGESAATGEEAGTAALAAAAEAAVGRLAAEFDGSRGGFGGAPKFPPSMVLEFLLRHAERAPDPGTGPDALAMASVTAEAMARGGIYDQLGGGFARYSVDADWIVPHFEKMLYDNALLARVYAHLWRQTGSPLARRVAEETCDFMLGELRTEEGGFASALDADSDGSEGAFYVWSQADLAAVLGQDDAAFAAAVFGVTPGGTFEHGKSVLQRPAGEPADAARLERVRAELLRARASRPRPGRDDKVVAAWNGLAIAALAEAGVLLDRPDFVAAATAAADLIARVHVRDGRLLRTSRDGATSETAGVLEDYGCVAEGLIALCGVTGSARWLALTGHLLNTALARFRADSGGFYDTADDSERLFYRPADIADGPSPSGTFAIGGALLSYSALTGSAVHREAAMSALGTVPALAGRYPRATGWGLAVGEAAMSGPVEIAVVGPAGVERGALHKVAMMSAPPGAVIALGDGGAAGDSAANGGVANGGVANGGVANGGVANGSVANGGVIPLLAGKTAVDGSPAAYVCRNFACRAPVTDPGELESLLG